MRARLTPAAAMTWIAATLAGCCSAPGCFGPNHFAGRVVEAGTGRPIAGALFETSGEQRISDADGCLWMASFVDTAFKVRRSGYKPLVVVRRADQAYEEVLFELAPTASPLNGSATWYRSVERDGAWVYAPVFGKCFDPHPPGVPSAQDPAADNGRRPD